MRREPGFPDNHNSTSNQHLLRAELNGKPMPIPRFLLLARNIAAALTDYHQVSGVHSNINPEHLVINLPSDQVLLTDPNRLPNLNIDEYYPLAYISPEQTGRLNQALDYRSDLYSLGITLYEMLTGTLPFSAREPLEWVHYHIARNPVNPIDLVPGIPIILSEIIIRLLAKSPQERFQTSHGLLYDLEQCLEQWTLNGEISNFVPGTQDVSDTLLIPQRLYGREAAFKKLLQAFDLVTGKHIPQMVVISGYSGIGKTALVRELYKAVADHYGYFISGKFEQFSEIPYSTISSSFAELIQQLLSESDELLGAWKEKIISALGSNAQLIIDLIPQLEIIIGKQKPVMQMPPTQAQNRFHMAFGQFMSVFSSIDRPLVWFLDDLQWIDPASLKLLLYLIEQQELPPFLFIGAYRDNELSTEHPLLLALNSLGMSSQLIHNIELGPLTATDIAGFLSDALPNACEDITELAQVFMDKTAGNAFFMIQFLKSLHAESLIFFDKASGQWCWNVTAIKKTGYTDNVVDFMLIRLRSLDQATQTILQFAACIGGVFDLSTLTVASNSSFEHVQKALQEAINDGLVLQYGDNIYNFQHDRIQQAAYNLIPFELRPHIHLQVGTMLVENTLLGGAEPDIFAVVNQLNLAIELICEPEDRARLSGYNLAAGKKAKTATAYGPAYRYLQTAIGLLNRDSWDAHYELTLHLHEEAAETAYLLGSYAETDALVDSVLDNARTVLDKTMAYMVRIDTYIAQSRINKAVETGLEILGLLGLNIPQKPRPFDVDFHLFKTKWLSSGLWHGKRVEDLLELPTMTNPVSIAQMEIMNTIFSALYITNDPLMPLDASLMTELSMHYGNYAVSPYGYATYGFVLCARNRDIETGYRFGQLALRLLEDRLLDSKAAAKTLYAVHGFSTHSKQHLRDCLPGLLEVSRIGMETGDFEYAGRALTLHPRYMFLLGEPLPQVNKIIEHNIQTITQLKQQGSLLYLTITQQAVTNLLRETPDPTCLNGPYYDEERMLPLHEANNDSYGIFQVYFHKLLLAYLFNDYVRAREYADQVRERVFSSTAQYFYYYSHAYDSLALLASLDNASRDERRDMLKRVAGNQARLKKWAYHAPMNHQHRWHMVEGELARVNAQYRLAHQHFLQAIELANQSGYAYEEGLAFELLGRLHRQFENQALSSTFLREARSCYQRWGGEAKVRDMDKYSQNSAATYNYPAANLDQLRSMHTGNLSALDLTTVLKASHAISEEMLLEPLLGKLMHIVIENAGAQRGVLLTNQDNRLTMAAQASMQEGHIVLMETAPDLSSTLPWSIINYAKNTRESLIVNDPLDNSIYANDSYIRANRPQSLLCLPVIKQNKLIAILYLENNLLSGAFTPEKLSIIELMTSQAAISIENAALYSALSSSEERYRTIFQNTGTAMMFIEDDMTISMSNKEFHKLIGYSAEEIDGEMKWTDLVYDQEDLQKMLEYHKLRRPKPTAVPTSYECKMRNRYGGYRDMVLYVVMMPEGMQSLASLIDITKRKQAEEALRQSEEKYRTIFENTGTATIIVENDTIVSLANSEFCHWSGYSKDEIENKISWLEFVKGTEQEKILHMHNQRRADIIDLPNHYELTVYDRNGNRKNILLTVAMITKTQSVVGLIDITERLQAEEEVRRLNAELELKVELRTQDLTAANQELISMNQELQALNNEFEAANNALFREIAERKKIEEALAAANLELSNTIEQLKAAQMSLVWSEKMASLGRLVAGVAHEINTPVGVGVTAASNLEQITKDFSRLYDQDQITRQGLEDYLDDCQTAVSIITTNLNRASHLIRSFKEVSVDQTSETRRVFRVKSYLDEILLSLHPKLKKTSHVIMVNCDETLEIDNYPGAFAQILTNLVMNSLVHAYDQDESGHLIIEVRKLDGSLQLDYSDDGKGIEPESLSKIFDPFFTTDREHGGTGLGLSIVYNIVTIQLEGTIECSSQPGQGTSFRIRVPLTKKESERA